MCVHESTSAYIMSIERARALPGPRISFGHAITPTILHVYHIHMYATWIFVSQATRNSTEREKMYSPCLITYPRARWWGVVFFILFFFFRLLCASLARYPTATKLCNGGREGGKNRKRKKLVLWNENPFLHSKLERMKNPSVLALQAFIVPSVGEREREREGGKAKYFREIARARLARKKQAAFSFDWKCIIKVYTRGQDLSIDMRRRRRDQCNNHRHFKAKGISSSVWQRDARVSIYSIIGEARLYISSGRWK